MNNFELPKIPFSLNTASEIYKKGLVELGIRFDLFYLSIFVFLKSFIYLFNEMNK